MSDEMGAVEVGTRTKGCKDAARDPGNKPDTSETGINKKEQLLKLRVKR